MRLTLSQLRMLIRESCSAWICEGKIKNPTVNIPYAYTSDPDSADDEPVSEEGDIASLLALIGA